MSKNLKLSLGLVVAPIAVALIAASTSNDDESAQEDGTVHDALGA